MRRGWWVGVVWGWRHTALQEVTVVFGGLSRAAAASRMMTCKPARCDSIPLYCVKLCSILPFSPSTAGGVIKNLSLFYVVHRLLVGWLVVTPPRRTGYRTHAWCWWLGSAEERAGNTSHRATCRIDSPRPIPLGSQMYLSRTATPYVVQSAAFSVFICVWVGG